MADDATPAEPAEDLRSLLGDGPIPFPAKTERKFQPWHRPRKQYVRSIQWSRELWFLARDIKLTGELRYFTLPGSDLLDIRYIGSSVCMPRKVLLKYLGFNTAASPLDASQPQQNAALFSVNRLDYIHPESEVFPGDFRSVGDPRSISWERVRRAGPFHAINLDLCGGFAGRDKANRRPNYFAALQALLQNQRSADTDFLLFITTRMDDDNIDSETQMSLNKIAQDIHDACDAYATEFAAAWGLSTHHKPVRLPELVGTSDAFMLGLTQWIVSQGVDHGLKAKVRSLMTYRTGAAVGDDDIVSLAIRFKPDPYVQPDSQGLVKPSGHETPLDEKLCVQSAQIPKKVRDRVFVDEILKTKAEEFQRCMSESSELLATAGYDPDSYLKWVMEESARYGTAQ